MYHPDLREEIRFLTARLLYKTKKLDEAVAAREEEKAALIREQVQEIEGKLQVCKAEMDALDEYENDDWKEANKD